MEGNEAMDGKELDRLLARMRALPPEPSAALMERVLADALAGLPRADPAVTPPAPPQAMPARRGWLRALVAGAFGGAGVVPAGLAAAAMLGLFLGYADPGEVTERLFSTAGSELELLPAAAIFISEG